MALVDSLILKQLVLVGNASTQVEDGTYNSGGFQLRVSRKHSHAPPISFSLGLYGICHFDHGSKPGSGRRGCLKISASKSKNIKIY